MRDRPLNVRFCGDCGRMILVGFEYCPYCGSRIHRASEGRASPAGGRLTARQVAPPCESPSVPDTSRDGRSILRDNRDPRILLDRLIRELEVLDEDIEEWAVNGKR